MYIDYRRMYSQETGRRLSLYYILDSVGSTMLDGFGGGVNDKVGTYPPLLMHSSHGTDDRSSAPCLHPTGGEKK